MNFLCNNTDIQKANDVLFEQFNYSNYFLKISILDYWMNLKTLVEEKIQLDDLLNDNYWSEILNNANEEIFNYERKIQQEEQERLLRKQYEDWKTEYEQIKEKCYKNAHEIYEINSLCCEINKLKKK